MQQPTNQKRRRIVHDFAKWTALSALRSGSPIKAAKQVYGLIENHADLDVLFDPTSAISQSAFDRWHEKTVMAFLDVEPDLKRTSQVGWAAKIVNVYLKTRVYLAGDGREGLVSAIHPPIDNGLVTGLRKAFPLGSWRIKRIKNIQSYRDDYLPFIEECRRIAHQVGFLPIEVEFYWQWVEDTGQVDVEDLDIDTGQTPVEGEA
jgi:hypothetical protein